MHMCTVGKRHIESVNTGEYLCLGRGVGTVLDRVVQVVVVGSRVVLDA